LPTSPAQVAALLARPLLGLALLVPLLPVPLLPALAPTQVRSGLPAQVLLVPLRQRALLGATPTSRLPARSHSCA